MKNQQSRKAARKLRKHYERFYEKLIEDAGREFLKYLYALLMKVYELDYENKFMNKSQASKYIPLAHATTRRKYLDQAVLVGLLKFEPNPTDGRSELIKPGPKLRPFVTGEIEELNAIDMPGMTVIKKRS